MSVEQLKISFNKHSVIPDGGDEGDQVSHDTPTDWDLPTSTQQWTSVVTATDPPSPSTTGSFISGLDGKERMDLLSAWLKSEADKNKLMKTKLEAEIQTQKKLSNLQRIKLELETDNLKIDKKAKNTLFDLQKQKLQLEIEKLREEMEKY